jgi:hypothetical protein
LETKNASGIADILISFHLSICQYPYHCFDMTLAAVSYAVKRGEKIAKEASCHLND